MANPDGVWDREGWGRAAEAAVASDPDRIRGDGPGRIAIGAAHVPDENGPAVVISASAGPGLVSVEFVPGRREGAEDEVRRFRRDLARVMAEFGIPGPRSPDAYLARSADPASEIPALCSAIAHRIRPILMPPPEPELELDAGEVRPLAVPPRWGGGGK